MFAAANVCRREWWWLPWGHCGWRWWGSVCALRPDWAWHALIPILHTGKRIYIAWYSPIIISESTTVLIKRRLTGQTRLFSIQPQFESSQNYSECASGHHQSWCDGVATQVVLYLGRRDTVFCFGSFESQLAMQFLILGWLWSTASQPKDHDYTVNWSTALDFNCTLLDNTASTLKLLPDTLLYVTLSHLLPVDEGQNHGSCSGYKDPSWAKHAANRPLTWWPHVHHWHLLRSGFVTRTVQSQDLLLIWPYSKAHQDQFLWTLT